MTVRIVGAGLAGSLLAWRLAQHGARVELVTAAPGHVDATAVSGGMIRGFEPLAEQRALAIDSLLELAADTRLRTWARYRTAGSTWVVADLTDVAAPAAELDRHLPGSVELLPEPALRRRGWAGLPPAGGAVIEQRAGSFDPHALRTAVLRDLAGRRSVTIGDDLRHQLHRDADRPPYTTVVATGAWTPAVLATLGRTADGLRTKRVQYAVHRCGPWRPGPFVDTVTGLFGRPVDAGVLLGLPTDDRDVDPGDARFDERLAAAAARLAVARLPRLDLGPMVRRVAAADCYADLPVLALRPAGDGVHTFTGGSGGAAKAALAASDRAVRRLLGISAPPTASSRTTLPHLSSPIGRTA